MLNVYLFIVQRGFLGMSHGQCVYVMWTADAVYN